MWKLEDAKARFSEVVRRAHRQGPQYVTVRGKPAVVVIDVDDFEHLMPAQNRVALVDFLQSLYVEGFDLERDKDTGRESPL